MLAWQQTDKFSRPSWQAWFVKVLLQNWSFADDL
jgi:hypothetical protein